MIRDLCFAGPFAERYRSHFPTFQGADGKVAHEVLVAMVTLVATAVSVDFFFHVIILY